MTLGPRVARDLVFFWSWFVPVRMVLLILLGIAVRGREICDDLMFQRWLVEDPLIILMGRAPFQIASYAPFQGILQALVTVPFRAALPDFYAWRLSFLVWEALMGSVFVLLLNRLFEADHIRRRLILAFVACPGCWMASVVMPQDEVLIGLFLALTLWLVATGRHWSALWVCGFGVVASKVLLVLPLAALVLLLPVGNLVTRGLAGFGLVGATYAWLVGVALVGGTEVPLLEFIPVPIYGVNLWVWIIERFEVSGPVARRVSSILALLSALTPVLWLWVRRLRGTEPSRSDAEHAFDLSHLCAVLFLWFFVFFYQVNPEYYALMLPSLLILFRSWVQLAGLFVALSLPWLTNWVYGVWAAGQIGYEGREGKAFFIELYEQVVPLELEHGYQVIYWLGVVGLTALTIWGTILFVQNVRRPRPIPGVEAVRSEPV